VVRPTVRAKVQAVDGSWEAARFLVDSGADATVFTADLLQRLNFPVTSAPGGWVLAGIGGRSSFVVITTTLEFTRDDGGPAHVRGQFDALTDPAAADMSMLGRNVLDNFDLILSRPRNEILLLAGRHQYQLQIV
jgi:hypothetical protein